MNLIESLVARTNKARELLEVYKSLGPQGFFGTKVIEEEIKKAETAMGSGDLDDMLRSYQSLGELK